MLNTIFLIFFLIGIIVAPILFIKGLIGFGEGISKIKENQKIAWDYVKKMEGKNWDELSWLEKEKLIEANEIINREIGIEKSREEIIADLERQSQ